MVAIYCCGLREILQANDCATTLSPINLKEVRSNQDFQSDQGLRRTPMSRCVREKKLPLLGRTSEDWNAGLILYQWRWDETETLKGSGANSKNSTPYRGVNEVRVASFPSFLHIEG